MENIYVYTKRKNARGDERVFLTKSNEKRTRNFFVFELAKFLRLMRFKKKETEH